MVASMRWVGRPPHRLVRIRQRFLFRARHKGRETLTSSVRKIAGPLDLQNRRMGGVCRRGLRAGAKDEMESLPDRRLPCCHWRSFGSWIRTRAVRGFGVMAFPRAGHHGSHCDWHPVSRDSRRGMVPEVRIADNGLLLGKELHLWKGWMARLENCDWSRPTALHRVCLLHPGKERAADQFSARTGTQAATRKFRNSSTTFSP